MTSIYSSCLFLRKSCSSVYFRSCLCAAVFFWLFRIGKVFCFLRVGFYLAWRVFRSPFFSPLWCSFLLAIEPYLFLNKLVYLPSAPGPPVPIITYWHVSLGDQRRDGGVSPLEICGDAPGAPGGLGQHPHSTCCPGPAGYTICRS